MQETKIKFGWMEFVAGFLGEENPLDNEKTIAYLQTRPGNHIDLEMHVSLQLTMLVINAETVQNQNLGFHL